MVAEKPVTPSPSAPAAPAPKGSVRQMHPIDRAARARKAERPPSKAEQWARAVEGIQAATAPASAPSVAAVDEVLADHIRAEGSRPEQPEFVTDLELQRLRRDQAEWDEALARRRAARADLTTSRGG